MADEKVKIDRTCDLDYYFDYKQVSFTEETLIVGLEITQGDKQEILGLELDADAIGLHHYRAMFDVPEVCVTFDADTRYRVLVKNVSQITALNFEVVDGHNKTTHLTCEVVNVH